MDFQAARSLGSATSATADSFSEANAIRAGINYHEGGFFRNAGLPNQGGTQYGIGEGFCKIAFIDQAREQLISAGGDEWSTRSDADVRDEYQRLTGRTVIAPSATATCPDVVYTHYPQGPDLLVGIFLSISPLDQLWRLRLLPLVLTLAAQLWLFWELRHRFGGPLAALAIAIIATTGAIRLFSHGLHQQGYTTALLLMQIAVTFWGLRRWRSPYSKWLTASAMGILGFLQGWLSFDFFFLVVFASFPFLFYERRLNRGTAAVFIVVPLLAFGAAHALHFLQVAIYYGSIAEAAKDLFGSAMGRSTGPYDDFTGTIPSAGDLVLDYLVKFVFLPSKFFGWALPVAMLGFLLALVWHDLGKSGRKDDALHAFITLVVAMLISSLWIFVMRQHAVVHTHFLPRHYLLLFAVALYLIGHLLQPLQTTSGRAGS